MWLSNCCDFSLVNKLWVGCSGAIAVVIGLDQTYQAHWFINPPPLNAGFT